LTIAGARTRFEGSGWQVGSVGFPVSKHNFLPLRLRRVAKPLSTLFGPSCSFPWQRFLPLYQLNRRLGLMIP